MLFQLHNQISQLPFACQINLQEVLYQTPLALAWKYLPSLLLYKPGGLSEVVRPDPIPNSVVKRFSGDDNAWATGCENTSLPDLIKPSLKEGFLV